MELLFDSFSKEYRINLKGELTHQISLSTDLYGNIQRMDNELGRFGDRLTQARQELDSVKQQLQNAKLEMEKPFPQEDELKEKSARLEELVPLGRNNYCTREHDSLKISNGTWYGFSQGVGGVSALDYLIKVKHLSLAPHCTENTMEN